MHDRHSILGTVLLATALLALATTARAVSIPGVPASETDPLGLVYELNIPVTGNWNNVAVPYSTDNSGSFTAGSFDRVAYYLKLDTNWVYVSFDSGNGKGATTGFTNDAKKIGIPTTTSGVFYNYANTKLGNMNVWTNVPGIVAGTKIATGNIEFWPSNYGAQNDYGVPGANAGTYDFGDGGAGTGAGYGSMQIHNYGAAQTLFAYNNWNNNSTPCLGIGNQPSGNPDWTFNTNAGSYSTRLLQIFAGNAFIPTDLTWNGTVGADWTSANWTGTPPAFPNSTTNATIDASLKGLVNVTGSQAAFKLNVNGGDVVMAAGSTLTLGGDLTVVPGSSLTLGTGAKLTSGGGSADLVKTNGSSTFDTLGTLTVNTLNDQGIAGTLTKTGGGKLVLDNSAGGSTLTQTALNLKAGTFRGIGAAPLAGAPTVTLDGGTLEVQGAPVQLSALRHYGYLINNDALACDLNNNAGMMGGGNPTTFTTFYGQSLMTTGPRGIGLSYQEDGDYMIDGAIARTQFDNYSNMWLGYLHVDAANAGNWTFQRTRQDDITGFWLDLNQDGVFQSTTAGLGSNRGEQLRWNDAAAVTVSLTPGDYLMAFTHREGGGGSQAEFTVKSPAMGAAAIVNPASPAQAGYWFTNGTSAVDLSGVPLSVLSNSGLKAVSDFSAAFGPLTLTAGTTLTTSGASMSFTSIAPTGGAAGRTITLDVANQATTPAYTDGGVATNLVKNGAGSLTLQNVSAVAGSTFRVNAGTLAAKGAAPLSAAGQLILGGGTFEAQGADGTTANALNELGYHYPPEASMNLHNNGGVLTKAPDARALLTRNVLAYYSDTDFISTGGVATWDNYVNIWTGYLNVPAGGSYEFKIGGQDDRSMIWIDLNQNGIFESTDGTLKTNNGELVRWQDNSTYTVSLAAGTYKVAIGHGEYTGGASLSGAYIKTPSMAAQALISPANPSQAGVWSADTLGPIDQSATDVQTIASTSSTLRATTDYTARFGNLSLATNSTLSLAGAPIAFTSTTFTPGSTLLAGVDGANTGALKTNGGQSNIGSTWGNPALGGRYLSPIVTPTTYNDQGIANSIMRLYNSATLALDNTTPGTVVAGNTTFQLDAFSILRAAPASPATLPLGAGSPIVRLNGGTLDLQGVPDGGEVANALSHIGYHGEIERATNLEGTNGIAKQDGVLAIVPYNRVRFTDAAAFAGRGLNPQADADFIATGAVNQVDNFSNVWRGYLNVTTAGNYEFKIGGQDDRGGIWLDLNQDGIFQMANGGLQTNNGELIAWQDNGTKTYSLNPGKYLVAITHAEGGGGSNVSAYIKSPTMAAQALIKPSDPAQAGLWSIPTLGPINMTNTNVSVAGASSTISALTDTTASFGTLSFESSNISPGVVTISGGGTVRFAGTNLASASPTVSYSVPAGTVGNQTNFAGSMGMDFDLVQPLTITSLGVFDSGSNGLIGTLNVRIYDRNNTATPLTSLTFSPANQGTAIDGSRFLTLPTPITLPAGFRGSIVADGFGVNDPDGNAGTITWTMNSGNNAIQFVGAARYTNPAAAGAYPNQVDGGPANRYAAGTFQFTAGTYGGINALAETTVFPGALAGAGARNFFFTQGRGDVVLDQPATGLQDTTIETRGGGGRLILTDPSTVAGARLSLGATVPDAAGIYRPGILVFTSPDGNPTTYPNLIAPTASGTIIGGSAAVQVDGSPAVIGNPTTGSIILPNVHPTDGAVITMRDQIPHCTVILPNGVNSPSYTVQDALAHYGYHINNDGLALNLNNNGGLLNKGLPTAFQTFYGKEVLTSGPGNRGLDYNDDVDFIAGGAIGQVDNYSDLFVGMLHVDPAKAGNWSFRINAQDDVCGLWIDLNRNGVFQSTDNSVNSDRGEELLWNANATTRTVNLAAGDYMVAFTHREGGGGSQIDIQFQAPGMAALTTIKPADPAQAGLWSMPVTGGGLDIAEGEIRTLGPLTLATLTLSPGGTLIRNGADIAGGTRDITVTDTLTMNKDLAMTLGRKLTTVGATVNVNSGATLYVDRPVNAANLNLLGNLVVTGSSFPDITVSSSMTLATTIDLTKGGTLNAANANITVNPTGKLATAVPLQAKTVNTSGTLTTPGANLTDLYINGGTTTLTGDTTLTGGLYGSSSGTLVTKGSMTITPSQALGFGGQLNVTSGTLTINSPAAATGSIAPGALARWSFDNGANLGLDSMGNYNGTVFNGPTQIPGKIGGAMNLNSASSQYMSLPAGFADFSTGMTLSGWVYYNTVTTWPRIFDLGNGQGNNNILLARNGTSNNATFEIYSAGGSLGQQTVANAVPAGQWVYISETLTPGPGATGNISNMYVNGSLVSTQTYAALPNVVTRSSNYLGRSNWAADAYMNGTLDEMTIYNKPLDPSQVQALYRAGMAGTYAAQIGDVRLAPGTQVNIAGSGVATANSAGITGGPTVTGPFTISPDPAVTSLAANAPGNTLTLDGTLAAKNFKIAGPGTVALTHNLSMAAGSTLSVDATSTLSARGDFATGITIDASQSGLNVKGQVDITSGKLIVNMPASVLSSAAAYYSFDSTSGTTVNNQGYLGAPKNGTLLNGATVAVAGGKLGNGMAISATDTLSRMELGTAITGPVPLGNESTISAWFYNLYPYNPGGTGNNWRTLFRSYANDHQIMVANNSNALGLYDNATGGLFRAVTPAANLLPNDGWHQITAVGNPDSNTSTVYIDGTLAGTVDRKSVSDIFSVGNYQAGGQRFAQTIDEVAIYNRALSTDEIKTLYNAGSTGNYAVPYSLGSLKMAAGTQLVLGGSGGPGTGAATFDSITAGTGTSIQGLTTVNGPVTIGSSPGTLSVVGSYTMGAGSTYNWETRGTGAGNSDLIAVSGTPGTLDVSAKWNLTVAPLAVVPDAKYTLFTATGGITKGADWSNVAIKPSGAYGDLVDLSKTALSSDATTVSIDIVKYPTVQWNSSGGTAWNIASHWSPNAVPDAATAAVVNTPGKVATVSAAIGPQAAKTLIVDGGSALIEQGGSLAVTNNVHVLPTGQLTVLGTLTAAQLNTAGTTILGPNAALYSPTWTPPAGAVAYWSFNDAANLGKDTMGTYNGTLLSNNAGPLPTQVPGKIGGAINLSQPSQQYVQLGSGLADFTQGMTVSGWVYYNSVNNWARIIDFGNGSANDNIVLARNAATNNLTLDIYNGAGSAGQQTVANVLPTGQWIYVAETLTPGTGGGLATSRIYLNGALASTQSYINGVPRNITRTLNYLGKSNWPDDYLNGNLDELYLYNRPLSADEIGNLYQAGMMAGSLPSINAINVTGGTTTGQGTTLGAQTTLKLTGGTLAGSFTSLNTSTTAGTFAYEIQGGTSNAVLMGNTASLHVSGTGTAAINGPVYLNKMSVDGGTTTVADNNTLLLNELAVSGGTLNLNRPALLGVVGLTGGTLRTTRGMTVTGSLGGAGTLVTDGSQVLDLTSASAVAFGGTLRVTNSNPANSADLVVNVPAVNLVQAVTQNFDGGGTAYTPRNEAGATWSIVNQGPPQNNFMRLLSNVTGTANQIAFDRTLTGPQSGISATFDMRFTNSVGGADGGAFVLLPTATYGTTGTGPNSPPWDEPNVAGAFGVGFDIYYNNNANDPTNPPEGFHQVSLHWNGALIAQTVLGYDFRDKGWESVNVGVNYAAGGAYVSVDIAGNSIYNNYWIPGMVPYESRALFGGRTGGLATFLDVDNIDIKMGTMTPSLGDLRLDSPARFALGGGAVSKFTSIGATGGITVTGGLTLSPTLGGANPTVRSDTAQDVTINAGMAATSFNVTGAGTVTLTDRLTVSPGGTFSVPKGSTLATQGNVAVDISGATVSYKGGLNVTGTLAMKVADLRPSGSLVTGAAVRLDGTDVNGDGTIDSLANGTAVATWVNKGTLTGVNAAQVTAARQPAVTTVSMNGNSVLSFSRGGSGATGIEDYLEINNAALAAVLNNPHTIFVVSRTNNGGADDGAAFNNHQAIVASPGNHNDIRFTGGTTSGSTGVATEQWFGNNAGAIASSGTYTQGTVAVLDQVVTGSSAAGPCSVQLFSNGTAFPLATNANVTHFSNPNILRIGAANIGGNYSWYLNGDVAEVLVYPSALSASDRQSVENYLMNKWVGNYTALGDLNLAAGAQLILNTQSGGPGTAGFTSITSGHNAVIDGNAVVNSLLDPTGSLTITHNLELTNGAVVKFDLTPDPQDLIHAASVDIDNMFTLELFGGGGTLGLNDKVKIFDFNPFTGLTINGLPWDGSNSSLNLAGLIQVMTEDPYNNYIWDTCNAQLVADTEGIYLTGLVAELMPEPTSLLLLGLGALALARRKRTKKARA